MTDDDLAAAHLIAAAIVDRHGARFLPVFQRLEAELARRDASADAIARAREVARDAARHRQKERPCPTDRPPTSSPSYADP
jgi:predicted aminopeptidase